MVNRLGAMRGPGESYSDVIVRIAGRESAPAPHSSGPFRPCLRAPLDGSGGDVNLR